MKPVTKWASSLIVVALFAMPLTARTNPLEKLPAPEKSMAETYSALADAIIAVEKAEHHLISSFLKHYYIAAQHALFQAGQAAEGADLKTHLEEAAAQIANLANEGDREVDAIKLRLREEGHHHNTAEGDDHEWIHVKPELRQSLLALAKEVAQIAAKGDQGQSLTDALHSVGKRLDDLFHQIHGS